MKLILNFAYLCLFIMNLFSQGNISFITLGDWGKDGILEQVLVADEMSKWAMNNNANFVITVGDNMYDYGVKSTEDLQWKTSFEDVYTSTYLQIPWYATLGNHDYLGNVQAQIDYTDVSTRWKMPSRYYSFTYTLEDSSVALFVMMDTNPICLSDEESKGQYGEDVIKIDNKTQLRWLDSTLSNTPAKWKIVCGHHTMLSGGYHGGVEEMQEIVKPIFEKNHIDVYLCGHDHDMQHLVDNKINYFVSGAGSLTRDCENTEYTKFYIAKRSGFLGVNLSPKQFTASFIDEYGELLYTYSIKK